MAKNMMKAITEKHIEFKISHYVQKLMREYRQLKLFWQHFVTFLINEN